MLWLACTALITLSAFYVLIPLFRESASDSNVEFLAETELDRLLDRKAVIYKNLRDLELEYKMSRLSDADFQQLSAGYKNEAAVILQKLDQLGPSEKLGDTIEEEIAAKKKNLFGTGTERKPNLSKCPSCGALRIPGKQFCADCGHKL
jgi:hypothetical protein